MTVALPTGGIISADPRFIDFGGILSGSLGGEDQRLDRLGSRWGCDFVTKPMKGDEARVWIARLIRGRREKATIRFPQPGVSSLTTNLHALYADTAANAEVIRAFGSPAYYKEGMFFSMTANGKSSLYQTTGDGTGAGDGTSVFFGIQPPLNRDYPAGSILRWRDAQIEGFVKGDATKWTVDQAKIYGLAFTIEEVG